MNKENAAWCDADPLLNPEEILLAAKKQGINKVVFGVMLKFFEKELQFPTNNNRPSEELLLTLYKQLIDLKSADPVLQNYDWGNRSVERFRQEIRKYFGFRLFENADKNTLEKWLIENAFQEGMRLKKSKRKSFDFFKENKIELLDQGTLDAHVRSCYTKFDKSFLNAVCFYLKKNTKIELQQLIHQDGQDPSTEIKDGPIQLIDLKKDPPDISLNTILIEAGKLNGLKKIELPTEFLSQCNPKLLKKYYLKIMRSFPSEIKKISEETRYALVAVFCYVAGQNITDNFTEILLQRIHLIESSAEIHVEKKLIKQLIKTEGKMDILLSLAAIAVESPTDTIEKAIYPSIGQDKLKNLVEELRCKGKWYSYQVKHKMRTLYSHYHRRLLLILIKNLNFKSSNPQYDPLLKAIEFIKGYAGDEEHYHTETEVPIANVISKDWMALVFEEDELNETTNEMPKQKINRFYYELAIFNKFFENLSCKNISVEGSRKYRDPNEDLPRDWNANQSHYYKTLKQPEIAAHFTAPIKKLMHESLEMLNKNMLQNPRVKIIKKGEEGWIKISPSPAQAPPKNLRLLHKEIERRWQNISLLDVLKEADLAVGFTDEMIMDVDKQLMDQNTLRKHILLAVYGMGTNIGLKPVFKGNPDVSYGDLRYAKRICTENTALRKAIAKMIDQLLVIRDPAIWGNDTMSCICDSTLIRVMDQNFVAQWHPRYREKGIMIYWHVEKGAACVYSQLKTCLSSEVGSMMQGILRHDTKMALNKAYMDTHGQSLPGFGFSYLLGVSLFPRLKNIYKQKLYYVNDGDDKKYANLALILEDDINWNLIEEQYDEMVKNAAALKLGLVDADVIMKRFSKDNYNHPVYKAICELGKAIKTIFLCRYLASEELRIEIHESLNIVERVNGFMHFILFGKLGTLFTNQKSEQEKIILCLHLIEVCLVYVNTLMIQEVLSDPMWKNLLTTEDKRAITSLFHGHINPYGIFTLNMDERISIKAGDKNKDPVIVNKSIKILKNLLEEVE